MGQRQKTAVSYSLSTVCITETGWRKWHSSPPPGSWGAAYRLVGGLCGCLHPQLMTDIGRGLCGHSGPVTVASGALSVFGICWAFCYCFFSLFSPFPHMFSLYIDFYSINTIIFFFFMLLIFFFKTGLSHQLGQAGLKFMVFLPESLQTKTP